DNETSITSIDVFNNFFNTQNNNKERMTEENVLNLEGKENMSNLESEENVSDLESENEEDTEPVWFELYSQKKGFTFCVTHSDHNKVDKKPRQAHVLDERNKGHKAKDCPYHINLYRWKNDNVIQISSIIGTHDHEMVKNIMMAKPRYRQLTKGMKNNV
ncbi:945_t:CDS:2, partial [Cetraspora pellucida]